MDFLELAKSRHSTRGFTKADVPQEDVVKLLKAAQAAPSGGNCQPWHFYVVRDKAVQAGVADTAGGNRHFILTAPVLLVVCADVSRSEGRYGGRGRELYCIQDTAAAVQNILLCATSLGLGTCWCGAFDESALSDFLHLPGKLRPVAVIPIGYPASEPPVPTARRSLEEIATFIGEDSRCLYEEKSQRKIERCDMGSTVFEDVNLGGSSFNNINFAGVEITDANLADGKVHQCNLTNFAIYDCKIDGMTVNGKNVCELLDAML